MLILVILVCSAPPPIPEVAGAFSRDPGAQVLVPRTISVLSQLQTMLGKNEGSAVASQEVTLNRDWHMIGIWLVYDWYMVEKDGGRFFYRTFHLLEMILGQGSALSCWWPLPGRHHQTAGMRSWPLLSIWRRGYVPTGGTGPSNH